MIQGYIGDSGLPRNPDGVVAEFANLSRSAIWVAQVGLSCKRVDSIDVPAGRFGGIVRSTPSSSTIDWVSRPATSRLDRPG